MEKEEEEDKLKSERGECENGKKKICGVAQRRREEKSRMARG